MFNPRYIVVNQEFGWQIIQGGRRFPGDYSSKTQAIGSAIAFAEQDGNAGRQAEVWSGMRMADSSPNGYLGETRDQMRRGDQSSRASAPPSWIACSWSRRRVRGIEAVTAHLCQTLCSCRYGGCQASHLGR